MRAYLRLPFGLVLFTIAAAPVEAQDEFETLLQAAAQGHVGPQYSLGAAYLNGEGIPEDKVEAMRWFRMAAEQGSAEAQYSLGLGYLNGEGVPEDKAEGVRWWLQAAEQGLAEAQYNLGVAHDLGAGVRRNYAEAARWYGMAAEQGLVEARDALERVEARMAAEQGSPEWQFLLGYTRWTGRTPDGETTLKDHEEAVMWFRLAADQDFADAQLYLGLAYQTGEGVPEDDAEAVRWFRMAAEQGHAYAQVFLGLAYEIGEGVIKDFVLAHMWFNIAGAKGEETAREWRDNLERDMVRSDISRAIELARACMASNYKDCGP